MHALIIGATGATGKALTEQLLNHQAFLTVTIFVRKAVKILHPKLTVVVIDFDKPNQWQDKVVGDVLFSCLGTTLKQAGSQEAQYKVDYGYQYDFAKIAKQNGVKHYVLVSADMANEHSVSFYPRLKGKLDRAVLTLGFDKISILRPSLLERENSDRFGEKLAQKTLNFVNRFGLLMVYQPLPASKLAQAMIQAVLNNQIGVIDKQAIWQLIE